MTTFKFPETNLVRCVFSLRTNREYPSTLYDEFDHVDDSARHDLKSYTYRVPEHLKGQLKMGDFVVVHCATGYQLCEVTQVNVTSPHDEETFAPVVCRVDLQSYFDEVNKMMELAKVTKQLEEQKKKLEALVTYELLADKSPEFKALLDRYKELGGML